MQKTIPLPTPLTGKVYSDTVIVGPSITPLQRLRVFSNTEWEEFTLEWACHLNSKYELVERCGGAGDMGRDVIAFPNQGNKDIWVNFQCKHYDHPLQPNDIWIELGKVTYYSFNNEFTYPKEYWFVSPQGVGNSLGKLLKKPEELRQTLIQVWNTKCANNITKKESIPLEGSLLTYLQSCSFAIFDYIPPLRLIDEYKNTPYYHARFGGTLPERPPAIRPPASPELNELNYLKKLFAAYSEYVKAEINNPNDLDGIEELLSHYTDSRIDFYSAESLRGFSRDTLPQNSYEELLDEFYSCIKNSIRQQHNNGYQKILAAIAAAHQLAINSHALVSRMGVRDRGGICHQLANEREDIKWATK